MITKNNQLLLSRIDSIYTAPAPKVCREKKGFFVIAIYAMLFCMMKITNTVTGKREFFKAQSSSAITMYVCGVTPYDFSHIGHGRCYVAFDVLYRVLQFLGHTVIYCRNFTDIDDKLLVKAQQEFSDRLRYKEIAQQFIHAFHEDMKSLNCLSPVYEPRVTDHIPEIIQFIARLIDEGHAYVSDGDVYFDIATFPSYGKLSKQKLDDLKAGARVEINEKKRDPLDFALWKSEPEGEFWQSPWGYGRPGWHIECSTLADKYLGKHLDIHAGGLDLIFPHHENEIAQSESVFGEPLAHYWMHNGLLFVDGQKMSKSLGNFYTLRDVFKEFDPMVIRYYLLQIHYRSPLDFSFDDIRSFEKSYRKLIRFFTSVEGLEIPTSHQFPVIEKMLACLTDDLNTSGMFGVLFESLDILEADEEQRAAAKTFIKNVVGLTLAELPEHVVEMTPAMQQLIQEREEARASKDWTRADMLRDKLRELGYEVQDKKL
jgi:cysteinyl-tRNA synthetase